jgi:hypothetical protein
MKIINREEFLKLPSGVLFSDYYPCVFSGLSIKLESLGAIDFCYKELIGNVKFDEATEMMDMLDDAEENGSSFPLDFDTAQRDGMYQEEGLYAIYEPADIQGLIAKLQTLL